MNIGRNVKIKYHVDGLKPIKQAHNSEWCDLRSAEEVVLKKGDFQYINLGVSIKLPKDCEAIVAPRSSTYKNFKIIQPNSPAVIDNAFCGEQDIWKYPVLAMEDTIIHKNDRICQFRIQNCQLPIHFIEVECMEDENRGGIGSTGVN